MSIYSWNSNLRFRSTTFRLSLNFAIYRRLKDNGVRKHSITLQQFGCHFFAQNVWFWNLIRISSIFHIFKNIWTNLRPNENAIVSMSNESLAFSFFFFWHFCMARLQWLEQNFRKWNLLWKNIVIQWISRGCYWSCNQMGQFPALHCIGIAMFLCDWSIALTHLCKFISNSKKIYRKLFE